MTTGVAIATQRRGVGQARSSGVSPKDADRVESFQLRPPSSLVACQPPGPRARQREHTPQATTEKASGPRSWARNGDAVTSLGTSPIKTLAPRPARQRRLPPRRCRCWAARGHRRALVGAVVSRGDELAKQIVRCARTLLSASVTSGCSTTQLNRPSRRMIIGSLGRSHIDFASARAVKRH